MTAAIRSNTVRRGGFAAAIVLLHAAAAFELLAARPPLPPVAEHAAMTVRAVALAQPLPLQVTEEPIDAGLTIPAFEIAVPIDEKGSPCDIADILGRGLATDPAAMASLAAAAATPDRAVMVWSGGWTFPSDSDPLRLTLQRLLRTVPAGCLDEAMIGPRLIFVAAAGTTVTVAVGSGTWSWHMLLSKDKVE